MHKEDKKTLCRAPSAKSACTLGTDQSKRRRIFSADCFKKRGSCKAFSPNGLKRKKAVHRFQKNDNYPMQNISRRKNAPSFRMPRIALRNLLATAERIFSELPAKCLPRHSLRHPRPSRTALAAITSVRYSSCSAPLSDGRSIAQSFLLVNPLFSIFLFFSFLPKKKKGAEPQKAEIRP